LDTGHGVLDLRPGLFTIHDYFRFKDNNVALDGGFQEITHGQVEHFP
jgi:hypothetical protein